MTPKTVFITGASRGLGLGLTEQFARRGFLVFAAARKPEESAPLQELVQSLNGLVLPIQLDVDSDESLKTALARVMEKTDRLDILINNAGRYGQKRTVPIENIDLTEIRKSFETNTIGPLRVTAAFYPLLKKGKEKLLINMTSLMGSIEDNGSGGAYDYRLSKAALNMLTKNFANEFRQQGVTSVCLHPGWVKTDMGGKSAPVEIHDAVSQMTELILKLDPSKNGAFLRYDGKPLPW